jgi:hypothetical protein
MEEEYNRKIRNNIIAIFVLLVLGFILMYPFFV